MLSSHWVCAIKERDHPSLRVYSSQEVLSGGGWQLGRGSSVSQAGLGLESRSPAGPLGLHLGTRCLPGHQRISSRNRGWSCPPCWRLGVSRQHSERNSGLLQTPGLTSDGGQEASTSKPLAHFSPAEPGSLTAPSGKPLQQLQQHAWR